MTHLVFCQLIDDTEIDWIIVIFLPFDFLFIVFIKTCITKNSSLKASGFFKLIKENKIKGGGAVPVSM